jgi:hypothetical protein
LLCPQRSQITTVASTLSRGCRVSRFGAAASGEIDPGTGVALEWGSWMSCGTARWESTRAAGVTSGLRRHDLTSAVSLQDAVRARAAPGGLHTVVSNISGPHAA